MLYRTQGKLLTLKELAWELSRSRGYIFAMKRAGFTMPNNRATVDEAMGWLEKHPDFRSDAYCGSAARHGARPMGPGLNATKAQRVAWHVAELKALARDVSGTDLSALREIIAAHAPRKVRADASGLPEA